MTADSKGDGDWGDDDPSVFKCSIGARLQGEFQVTNGYGSDRAPQVMRVSSFCKLNIYVSNLSNRICFIFILN